jgi:hypothetical protein
LKARLKSRAWGALAVIAGAELARPVRVRSCDGRYRLTLTVAPADMVAPIDHVRPPGLHFSPAEAAVYQCLLAAGGGPLSGKQIAVRTSLPYETKLKYLLQNLEEREVLSLIEGKGYVLRNSVTPIPPTGRPG